MMDKVTVLFVGLLASASAQVTQFGQCSNVNLFLMNGFNPEPFFGTWYEIGKISSQYTSCSSLQFSSDATYGIALTNRSMIYNFPWTDTGYAIHASGTAQLDLYMAYGSTNFWILDTDYTNYVIAVSCSDLSTLQRRVEVWQLGRTLDSFAAQDVLEKANAALQPIGLSISDLQSVDHSTDACTELPQIAVGNPVILTGQCRSINPVLNFQMAYFTGTWYEISSYYWEIGVGSCARVEYSQTGGVVEVVHTRVVDDSLDTIGGTATLQGTGAGVLNVVLNVDGVSHSAIINILETDYDGFAILYSCENLAGTNNRRVYAWKLSRNQTGFSEETNERISQVMANNIDLNDNYFQLSGQSNNDCFYYPDLGENPEAIILPGTCPVLFPNVNMSTVDFLGNWYEVAGLPTGSQNRACSRTEWSFSPSYDLIDIRNTVVVDRQLITQNAETFSILESIGMMMIRYTPENGELTTMMCYVLDTDHISYSLLYCCRNVEGEQRQVFSWKLSRTPTLTDEANIAINKAISDTQGLLEEYYVPTSQSAEDCFYVPDYVPGQPVLFRGACEAVTGMQGFDASQYLGWWNEIERYPGNDVPGQCTSALFLQSGNVFHVMESSIAGGVSNETTSNAVLSSDGTITIQRSTGPIVWHVLDTDYNSYSLLYACEDVATDWGDYRRVWSAKHSKSQSLTETARNAMTPLIDANDLLYEKLYETVDHSDNACWHNREEVLLPGQCDTEIPVQPSFDISRYLGWWNEIERYPGFNVPGQCTSALFVQSGTVFHVMESSIAGGISDESTSNAVLSSDGTITIQRSTGPIVWHVLDTDYNSYSLLYACEDVATDSGAYRRLWSAKHSRARSLTEAAQNAMTPVIAANNVLYQQFYGIVDQTDGACWHNKEEVILPGQCDTEIPVQAGFDIAQFAGIWYQLERYPYAQVSNEATCVGARYTVSGNNVNILNWNELHSTLETIGGSATVDPATATLRVTLGEDTSDLRILTTDYEDYALAYTCANVNANQRSVGAFKLSRSRTLSSGGHDAIETYMADREELHQHYFKFIHQDDECPNSALLVQSSIIVMLVSFAFHFMLH